MKRWALLLTCFLAVIPAVTFAQSTYPDHWVRMIVPFAPGGATDVAARIVADAISDILGQPVVVENRAGSGGNIGVNAAASAAADGYTLLMGTQALLTQNPFLYAKLLKNPQTDLVPVAGVFKTDMILIASPRLGAKTVQDIISLAKAKPDTLNYGSAGGGSAAHILMELLKSRTQSEMRHVPYKGTASAMMDMVAGTLDVMIDSMPSAIGQINSGNVVPVAVCGLTRNSRLPNVPTMAEAGIKDFNAVAWLAVFAPKGTPAAVVEKVNSAIKKALENPRVIQRGEQAGLDPDFVPTAALATRIADESIIWSQVIKSADIKL